MLPEGTANCCFSTKLKKHLPLNFGLFDFCDILQHYFKLETKLFGIDNALPLIKNPMTVGVRRILRCLLSRSLA
jgi:hypothetical protein